MDLEQAYDDLVIELQKLGYSELESLADETGISIGTFYKWRKEKVVFPRVQNLLLTLEAIGYQIKVTGKRNRRRIRYE